MSGRNRPRGSIIKDDLADEVTLWNSVVEKIKRASVVRAQFDVIADKIATTEAEVPDIDPTTGKPSLAKLEDLERFHREGLRLAEEELKILLEEPDDLIKNVETLISVRAAFEDTPAPRSSTAAAASTTTTKPGRTLKRRLDSDAAAGDSPAPDDSLAASTREKKGKTGSRAGSVAAAAAGEEKGALRPGAEVFYKNKKPTAEGEGILCQVIGVHGEGKGKKYEIQDAEPEDDAEPSQKVKGELLLPIPLHEAELPDIAKGRQVIALYPGTTTFYKAEMVGMRKDRCRLRFEGEEEPGKEHDVERRYVLDAKI